MSLKAVHIVFLVLSTCIAAGFGVWATLRYNTGNELFYAIAAVCAFTTAAALPVYGARFLRKVRELSRP